MEQLLETFLERILEKLELLESVAGKNLEMNSKMEKKIDKIIRLNSKKEEEAVADPEFRFVCKPCRYRTNHSGDWSKHLTRKKHIRMEEQKKEEEKKADVFYEFRSKYPELVGERDLDILTAYAWLHPLRSNDGTQAMCCHPLKAIWAAVHKYQFGGNYFMRGSKCMLFNKVLPRNQYTFEVFTKMVYAANGVLSEAKYLIEQRRRYTKYPHNRRNWREFDLATAQSLPVFRNEKTDEQKHLKSSSLHEYLQSCR